VRTLDLGQAAAQAELLRLKRLARRHVLRAIFGMIAVVFLIGTLILLHVVAYIALQPTLTPLLDGLALLGFDLVLAILFALLASRNTPDQIEIEAKLLREQALSEMKESLAIMALVGPLARLATRTLGARGLYGMTLAALTAKFFSNTHR
jgi:hypothetical protein